LWENISGQILNSTSITIYELENLSRSSCRSQDTISIYERSHVRNDDNSADIISRDCDASKLANMALMWHGPKWSNKNEEECPLKQKYDTWDVVKKIVEAKSAQLSKCVKAYDFPPFIKYSSLNNIIHIAAHWFRFRDFLVKKKPNVCILVLSG